MRAKTLITILLVLFVVVALGAIVMKSPAPAKPSVRQSATEATSVTAEAPASTAEAESQTAVPAAAPATITLPTPSMNSAESSLPVLSTRAALAVAKPLTPAASAPSPAEPSKQVRRVVATYFHGNVRCATCRKIESYAREAVEEGFKTEVASGAVEFRAVNLDEAGNAHFIQDYQLVNKSVVVTEELDGKVARWAKLDEVWSLVGNRDAYHHYVQDAVRGYLETE